MSDSDAERHVPLYVIALLPDVSPCVDVSATSAPVSDVSPTPTASDSVCKVLAPGPSIFKKIQNRTMK